MFSRTCSSESWNVGLLFIERTVSMSRTSVGVNRPTVGSHGEELTVSVDNQSLRWGCGCAMHGAVCSPVTGAVGIWEAVRIQGSTDE